MKYGDSHQRMRWLDISKGIAILCTIVGHTVAFGGHLRNLIFSFHMPLFFVASGYTIRPVSGDSLARATWKDFKRLYVPVLIVRAISFLLERILYKTDIAYGIWDNIRRILWGNGNDYTLPGGFSVYGVGVLWFLIALFWCKLAYRICLNKIQNYRPMFLLFLCLAGLWLGTIVRLPQCIDIIPIGMLFMEGGYQFRHSGREDAPAMKMAGVAAFFVWIYLTWTKGIYIEIATRDYPGSMLSIFIAFAACLCVFQFSKALEAFKSSEILAWLGKNSLDLLCIHHLDWYFMFWQNESLMLHGSLEFLNGPLSACYRIIGDVIVLLLWIGIKKEFNWLIRQKK